MPDYFDSGYSVREHSWHGKARVEQDYPKDWAQARSWADILWEPIYAPNFGFNGITADGKVTHDPAEAVTGDYFQDEDARRIIRSDTGYKLSVRDKSYEIITHEEMGAVMDALIGLPGIKYETAGSVHQGRWTWALVRLDEPVALPGDRSQTFPFMAALNRHDGTGAFKALATSVRVICSNTFSAAEAQGERNSTVFTFRHAANWRDHIEEAKLAVRGTRESFRRYVDIAADLAETKITPGQEERFVVEFVPVPPGKVVSEKVMANVETARQAVRDILASETVEGSGIRGTAFGLLQAAGEYADHVRETRKEGSLVARQLLSANRLKIGATQLIREVVKG
jgi:phage/plasmid-like protein (TIGR03299 family)